MDMRCAGRHVCRLLLAALATAALGGCAHTYIDGQGNRNIIGWVNLTLPPADPAPRAADWMRVRTVGLVLSRTDIGSAIELGYADSTLAAIRNDSCVQLDRLPSILFAGDSHAPFKRDR
jgi:hypothetical protein